MKIFGIIAAVVVLLLVGMGSSYVTRRNEMVAQREAIKNQWGQVDVVLERRADLIPNLVETVKGFAAQERAVFIAIADARARMAGARAPGERIEAGRAMEDRKSTRLNSSHIQKSRMPSSA